MLVHTPEPWVSGPLSLQANCFIDGAGSWMSHFRHTDIPVSIDKQKLWPFLYLDKLDAEKSRISHRRLEPNLETPRVSFQSHPHGTNQFAFSLKGADKQSLSIQTDKIQLIISPGEILLHDSSLEGKVFQIPDQNLCYRAFTLAHPSGPERISYNISVEMFHNTKNQETYVEVLTVRALFKDQKDFENGNVEEIDIYKAVISTKPEKINKDSI
jgi:hypothetical protein